MKKILLSKYFYIVEAWKASKWYLQNQKIVLYFSEKKHFMNYIPYIKDWFDFSLEGEEHWFLLKFC